jgi:type I restriction enzyme S subunit
VNEESNDGLPPGWESASLAALCQINPPLDRCVVNEAVEVNFVPMRAVESEGAGLLRPEVRPYGEVKKGYTSFLSGDVIMAKITPCMENGKTTVVPDLPGSVCFGSTSFTSFGQRPACWRDGLQASLSNMRFVAAPNAR